MAKALIYCRVSTEEQTREGHHSMSAQETLCKKLASEHGYTVSTVYRDPGKSATTMQRPGLQEMLAACQQDSGIAAVFVQDTDRLARNTKDHLTIRALLQKCDVKLISASQPMIEDSAEGNMIDTIIASVNQFQSDLTARKTLKGMEEKVRKGGWPGIAPLGYRNIGKGADNRERAIDIDPIAGPLVQKLFQLYISGQYSIRRLTNIMDESGLRSHTGRKVTQSKIHTILTNAFYIGVVTWGGISAKGTHHALITQEQFDSARAVRQMHGHIKIRERKHDFLYRGFVFCHTCKQRLIGETHILKSRSYYRCHVPGGCQPLVPVDELEPQIATLFSSIRIPQRSIEAIVEALKRSIAARQRSETANLRRFSIQKTALEEKLRRIDSKWLDRAIDDEAYQRLKSTVESQIDVVKNDLARSTDPASINVDEAEKVLAFVANLADTYANASATIRRLLLQFAWKRIETQNKKIVKAVPTEILDLLVGMFWATQKPGLIDRAFVHKGIHSSYDHPTQLSNISHSWRLRAKWGRGVQAIRPLNTRKIALAVQKAVTSKLEALIQNQQQFAAVIHLFRQIQQGMLPRDSSEP